MTLEEVRNKDSVIDYFVQLAQIPSPSKKEENVANKIIEILTAKGISAQKDSYGNVIARLDANNSAAAPIMISSHMDVVGTDEPVNIRVSKDGKYLETDKTRTLGADDKAGGAVIIDTLIYFKEHPEIPHPTIEGVFTRDEEFGMSGIENLDTTKLLSQNALILDGSDLGECNVAGASFTNFTIFVTEGKSGHSGIDIGDKTRVSANKVLSELVAQIPQGVYKENELGTITSINSGLVIGGSAGMYLLSNKNNLVITSQNQIMEDIAMNSFRNIIASNAYATYSIRSSEPENEEQLKREILSIVNTAAKKYDGKIKIEAKFETHLKPFVKDDNEEFVNILIGSAKSVGLTNTKPTSFHAGAETHVLQNDKLNAEGKKFKPLLLGVANILNMHSPDEMLDYESLIIGRNWIRKTITELK
ncbi:MAG: M20/M25/M40 family metallo-hydrolase [bacterium]|nr:M20/M25/M40 family metallo-hydrolase [bacterium]